MKINSSISTKTVRLLSHLLTFLLTIFTYSFSKAQDSLVIKNVKGTYYIRVSAAQVLSVPVLYKYRIKRYRTSKLLIAQCAWPTIGVVNIARTRKHS